MAKKKSKVEPAPKAAIPGKFQNSVIHLKGSVEYSEWLEKAHVSSRYPKATLVRMGLELVAKQLDLPAPPEI